MNEELRQFASDREWFIPVLLSECDVPARSIGAGETLLDINWVPLHEDWEAGIQRILSVIKPIPPKIQNLIYSLRTEDRDVRDRAVKALQKIGDLSTVPALIEALKDKDREVRWRAALALEEIGPEAKTAMPALSEALKDEDEGVRLQAVVALGKIGPEAKIAVPALIKARKDEDEGVRKYAVVTLATINTPETQKALEEYKQKSD
jgi:HEAT repeat protein